jgi:hypothetical protein
MPINSFSPAGLQLGLGGIAGLGTALSDQVADETEEERRKRMQQMQQQRLLGVAGGSTGGSAAAQSLFSPLFAGGRGGF